MADLLNINVLSFIVCTVILVDVNRHFEKKLKQNRVFTWILFSNLLLIAFDTAAGVFSGNPLPYARILGEAANYCLYLLYPLPGFLWVLYVNYQMFHNRKNSRKIKMSFFIPYLAHLFFVAANPFFQGIFYIDQANVFHRGAYAYAVPAVCYLYLLFAYILIFRFRYRIEKRALTALLAYAVPSVAASAIQFLLLDGMSLVGAGNTVALLIIYVSTQNRRIDTDYLTGLFNRREADNYLAHKIAQKDAPYSFSAVMIDIDKFKEINDRFGHAVGDQALEAVAYLLKKTLRSDDFIARYGGDEFLAVFDISEPAVLKKAIRRIRNAVVDFNALSHKPFRLSLSMGYAVYTGHSGRSAEQFVRMIDDLMYKEKMRKTDDQLSFFDNIVL